jgi:hypothetical protein
VQKTELADFRQPGMRASIELILMGGGAVVSSNKNRTGCTIFLLVPCRSMNRTIITVDGGWAAESVFAVGWRGLVKL